MIEERCWNCEDTGWVQNDYPPALGKRPCVRCQGHQEKRDRYRAANPLTERGSGE